ncbi:flavin-binding monooxygenase-like-domain-containing protein [Halenospora varia]|nr:flavin-binding monooxygenase-like-domain-containing protein [Halenospora varia]
MNNIPTSLLGLKGSPWKEGTPDYVKHEVILEYIRDFARENDVERFIQFNTRVEEVAKEGDKWHVKTSTLVKESVDRGRLEYETNEFDAVLVASGHYHAAKVPDLPGLQEWKLRWPDRVSHSRTYRNPRIFQGQNILLIGAGVSSTDIANEAGGFATKIYQVARSGPYDIPARFLPNNAERVAMIASFETGALLETGQGDSSIKLQDNEPIPAAIYLEDGRVLNGIHRILICTGYHISYPFLQALHRDNIPLEAADEQVLVTDGTQAHNLHKDIFYIPDPTLAFVGTAYSVSSFSLFEFQAIAVAAVFAGRAKLPREEEMRAEYRQRVLEKGLGRSFHVLKEGEIEYVESIVNWVNRDGAVFGVPAIEGHSNEWVRKNQERRDWVKKVFAPESTTGPPLSASATV